MIRDSRFFFEGDELDTADLDQVPRGERNRLANPRTIDVRPVGALQVTELELSVFRRGQTTVDSRDQRSVDNEVGPGGAANGFDRTGQNSKRLLGVTVGHGSQNPHKSAATFRRARSSTVQVRRPKAVARGFT